MKNRLLLAAIAAATVAIGVTLFVGAQALPGTLLRWLAIALIAAYATSRRSLTGWILVGLLAGAELGHDAPAVAEDVEAIRRGEKVWTSDSTTWCAVKAAVPAKVSSFPTPIF